jgi:hypothetical protein
MGDIQRLGSNFSLSSALSRTSFSLPKARVGAIELPEVSRTQVFDSLDSAATAISTRLDSATREIEKALQGTAAPMLRMADGSQVPAYKHLSPDEITQLRRLPDYYQKRVLDVRSARGSSQVQAQLSQNLKGVIQELTLGANVSFKEQQNRAWSVRNLLDLSLAVHELPLAHRKQLDGVSFVRAAEPQFGYKGQAPDLMEKLANKMVAGHYDLKSRSVILYDRGLQDGFPVLDSRVKQSLRSIQGRTSPTDIQALQKMLNPYLVGAGARQIPEDGKWGSQMEQAVRTVQAKLAEKYLSTQNLNPAQRTELKQLQQLAASPQFAMITRVTSFKDKMKNLNLLPDPQLQKLLEELSRSEFGEASLQFLLADVSDAFRSNPRVTRTEEVMLHEMGHHFQLGLSNENEYVAEFGKLSGWVERATGAVADGYIQGSSTAEEISDVYNQLASGNRLDEGHYGLKLTPHERNQLFVTQYASTDPMEDFAESYKTFILNPALLMERSPEKFLFINALPSIQSRKLGGGAREKSHYQPAQIQAFARQALQNKHQITPTQAQVNNYIRQSLEQITGSAPSRRPLNLSPETVLAVVDTHRDLLKAVDMPYIAPDKLYTAHDPDYAVLRQIHEQTLNLIRSGGNDQSARAFFAGLSKPQELERNFPKASPALRNNLKDPAFAAMMLALAKIGAHSSVINQARNLDQQDQQTYRDARDYFNTALNQPSTLLSTQVFSQSFNYLRSLSSQVVNPEDLKLTPSMQFFRTLEGDPARAFPESWHQFPDEFKDMLRNQRFVQAISGDQGRYLPSAEVTRETLQKVTEMIEFQRGIDLLRNG